jgi:ATP-dependent DNA helicase RecG
MIEKLKSLFEKILKIIEKEESLNYNNTAFFGGIYLVIKNTINEIYNLLVNSNLINNNLSSNILQNNNYIQNLKNLELFLLDYHNLNVINRKKTLENFKNKVSQLYNEILINFNKLKENQQNLINDISDNNNKYLDGDSILINEDFLKKILKIDKLYELNRKLEDKIEVILNRKDNLFKFLKKNNINTINDLLWFLPRAYSDRRNFGIYQDKIYAKLKIISNHLELNTNKNIKIIKYETIDENNKKHYSLVFFNQEFVKYSIKKGDIIKVFGRIIKANEIVPEEWEKETLKTLNFDKIVPIYPLGNNKLKQSKFRNIIYQALKNYYKYINDSLFDLIIHLKNVLNIDIDFLDLRNSLLNIHYPKDFEYLEKARNRLALEEIIYTQVLLNTLSKKEEKSNIKIDLIKTKDKLEEIKKILPFNLTNAQLRVLNDFISDFEKSKKIRRLIQGDVGAGKTVIAIILAYLLKINGYQSVLMAPTEVLANQHYLNFNKILKDFNLNIKLITSKIKGRQRKLIFEQALNGELDILIGTHALINENLNFKNLGLIVIDEQHKFGVNQRYQLYSKSLDAHLVVMSATPIPRTLALTVYSDLDISVIDELPPNRKKAITEIFNYSNIDKVYKFVLSQLEQGFQAYFICPAIQENEGKKIKLKNVEQTLNELQIEFKKYKVNDRDIRIGVLHGKMSSKEKESIMDDFRQGLYDILISTTVIEVGIDVPTANTIVILDAERFGLSQLHQLRGRVKRASHQPYCILVTSKNLNALEFSKALERLKILKYYDDGFMIAQKDLELRGPGEIIGYKQHGFTEFKALNPLKDIKLITFSNTLAKILSKYINNIDYLKEKIKQIEDNFIEVVSSI